jgi:hypothetical protein
VAIASSLFHALNMLEEWLRRTRAASPSVESSNMSLVTILRELTRDEKLRVDTVRFFRHCVKFGKMVRVAASTGLLKHAMALKTNVPDDSVENKTQFQGLSSVQVDI